MIATTALAQMPDQIGKAAQVCAAHRLPIAKGPVSAQRFWQDGWERCQKVVQTVADWERFNNGNDSTPTVALSDQDNEWIKSIIADVK
ncbi:hypothetical protein [Bradyrhizobium sp. LB11.1]|uniref:hypothetical protein n=1 Tax=Bradyrhizobium sp. LB11.1 TaxID=3156326 RepID=UPI003393FD25